jgi:ubiquinone biosynthesis protein COQ4
MPARATEATRGRPARAPSRHGSTVAAAIDQIGLCAKGAYQFLRRPTSRETFTALSEALVRFRSNQDAVDFLLEDPAVAQLCRERYIGHPYTPEELRKYPPGSLGREFAEAVLAHDFDPEFYRDYYGHGPPRFDSDEEYLRFRVRQTHDLVHVLTGFAMTEFPGELGMQAFLAVQTRRPFSIALVGFGLIRIVLKPDELPRTLHQVAKGLAMGYAARSLVGHRFEEDWAKPVEQWRAELGLIEEASFEFRAMAADASLGRRADRSSNDGPRK